jgi:hypothetical protein
MLLLNISEMPNLFTTNRHVEGCLIMSSIEETFTVWAELEGRDRKNYLVQPTEVEGERVFKILTESETLGVIHKTFEDTWECLRGNFTLQDSERLGDQIDGYQH